MFLKSEVPLYPVEAQVETDPSEDSAHVGAIGLALEPLAW